MRYGGRVSGQKAKGGAVEKKFPDEPESGSLADPPPTKLSWAVRGFPDSEAVTYNAMLLLGDARKPSDSSSPPSNDLQLLPALLEHARAHRRKLQELRRGKVSGGVRHVSGGVWRFLAHSRASGPLQVRLVGLPRKLTETDQRPQHAAADVFAVVA